MTRVYSHRRGGSNNPKKALPMEAMYAAGVSIASLVMYVVLILIAVDKAGETSRWIGGCGVLGLCAAFGSFVFNIGQMRKQTELKDKIICMSISSIIMVIWVVTLILGMLN